MSEEQIQRKRFWLQNNRELESPGSDRVIKMDLIPTLFPGLKVVEAPSPLAPSQFAPNQKSIGPNSR